MLPLSINAGCRGKENCILHNRNTVTVPTAETGRLERSTDMDIKINAHTNMMIEATRKRLEVNYYGQ